MKVKAILLSTSLVLSLISYTSAQSNKSDKLKKDIVNNTKVVSEKAGKNVEYVAKESGKNIQKISEKTAEGVKKTVMKIDANAKKKKLAKKK